MKHTKGGRNLRRLTVDLGEVKLPYEELESAIKFQRTNKKA
jgi:hypothetical protein